MQKSSDGKSVGIRDIGKEVFIGPVGKGILRYVGSVKGKQGLFCGVELEKPEGKHNGTYQGTTYFRCPMNHGVFAPVYKVEILSDSQEAEQSIITNDRSDDPIIKEQLFERHERFPLSSLLLEKFEPSVNPAMDVSMASISSAGSSFFDHSIISTGGFGTDMMVNSHATYTIASSHQFLEDIEFPDDVINLDSSAAVLQDETETPASFPEGDDVATPLVEYRNFTEGLVEGNFDLCLPSSSEADSCSNSNSNELLSTIPSQTSEPSPGSRTESSSVKKKSSMHTTPKPGASKRSRPAFKSNRKVALNEPSGEDRKKEEHPKKPKKPSVREYQNSPVQQRPPRQTQPTRTQLLMEQIKASIAAEKNKPKKEVKSRLAPLLAAPTPIKVSPAAENTAPGMMVGENRSKASPSPNAKRRRNEPLKVVNTSTNPQIALTPKCPKQRQSLLPPKNTPKIEKTDGSKKSNADRAPKRTQKDNSVVVTGGSKERSRRPGGTLNQPSAPQKSNTISKNDETIAMKNKQLKIALQSFDVMAVALRHLTETSERRIANLLGQETKLLAMIEENKKKFVGTQLEHSRHIENAVRVHNQEINELRDSYQEKIDEFEKKMRMEMEQQDLSHEALISQLKRDYLAQCSELKARLEKAEKLAEQLAKEKTALTNTLAKDQDEKTAGLLKEINSLNAALEMKSLENKSLRHENAELQLRVDEIPPKDIEISKLKHRVGELKLVVEQKKNNEKQLVVMYRELERLARSRKELSESALMENDLLRYRIEEMETLTTDDERCASKLELPSGAYHSPRSHAKEITFSANSRSAERPVSSIYPARLTQSLRVPEGKRHASDDAVLSRSVASVYLEQGRNRSPIVDVDTIYTPEGTFVARNRRFVRKLSFSDEGDRDDDVSKQSVHFRNS